MGGIYPVAHSICSRASTAVPKGCKKAQVVALAREPHFQEDDSQTPHIQHDDHEDAHAPGAGNPSMNAWR